MDLYHVSVVLVKPVTSQLMHHIQINKRMQAWVHPKKVFFSLKEKRIELHGGWYCAWYTNIPSGWYWQFIYDCIIYISYYFFSWWNHHLSGIRELFFKKIRIVYQHMNYIGWRYIFLMVNLKVILWFWTIWI